MNTPRPTSAVRRLESARTAVDLTASVLTATVQLATFAAVVRPALRAANTKNKRST